MDKGSSKKIDINIEEIEHNCHGIFRRTVNFSQRKSQRRKYQKEKYYKRFLGGD